MSVRRRGGRYRTQERRWVRDTRLSSEVGVKIGLGRNSKSMRMRIAQPYPAFLFLAARVGANGDRRTTTGLLALALFCLFSIACACRRSSSQGAYKTCYGLSCMLPLMLSGRVSGLTTHASIHSLSHQSKGSPRAGVTAVGCRDTAATETQISTVVGALVPSNDSWR
jgi:hypothetical protein